MFVAAALFLALTAARAGEDAMLPAPVDLRADGVQSAEQGKPIVILFSLPDCSYCKVVRENYLAPLLREKEHTQRPIIREVSVTSGERFTGFAREKLTHRELAKRYGVQLAPTVVLLDKDGRQLTDPIIGGDTAGLYGGYLDNAFTESRRKLHTASSNTIKGENK